ncbi:hypothetical protein ACFLQN_00015 [Candidatus Aenigmatarchaeota archaeon]
MEDEYELIPLSPIRRLEKRLQKVEKNATTGEVLGELMDIIKTNQQVVDHMAKTNSMLINRITDLSNVVEKMITKVDDFIERIETGESEEEEKKSSEEENKLNERLAKLEKRLNSTLLTQMAKTGAVPRRPTPIV